MHTINARQTRWERSGVSVNGDEWMDESSNKKLAKARNEIY